jgi:hypothetical protein
VWFKHENCKYNWTVQISVGYNSCRPLDNNSITERGFLSVLWSHTINVYDDSEGDILRL